MIVYLSGGMRSGWRDKVKSALPQVQFLDPAEHGLKEPDQYTAWDLAAIRKCDVVFVYFEATNPSGFGLSLEIGYARALGKVAILIDEQSDNDQHNILRATSDCTALTLQEGIEWLRSMQACYV